MTIGKSHAGAGRDLLEHLPWNDDLRHLKGDIASVAHDRGADLDQLFSSLLCRAGKYYRSGRGSILRPTSSGHQ